MAKENMIPAQTVIGQVQINDQSGKYNAALYFGNCYRTLEGIEKSIAKPEYTKQYQKFLRSAETMSKYKRPTVEEEKEAFDIVEKIVNRDPQDAKLPTEEKEKPYNLERYGSLTAKQIVEIGLMKKYKLRKLDELAYEYKTVTRIVELVQKMTYGEIAKALKTISDENFKAQYNPELSWSINKTCEITGLKKDMLREIGKIENWTVFDENNREKISLEILEKYVYEKTRIGLKDFYYLDTEGARLSKYNRSTLFTKDDIKAISLELHPPVEKPTPKKKILATAAPAKSTEKETVDMTKTKKNAPTIESVSKAERDACYEMLTPIYEYFEKRGLTEDVAIFKLIGNIPEEGLSQIGKAIRRVAFESKLEEYAKTFIDEGTYNGNEKGAKDFVFRHFAGMSDEDIMGKFGFQSAYDVFTFVQSNYGSSFINIANHIESADLQESHPAG